MNLSLASVVIPDALCMVMCGIGVITDIRSYRIPNWLTFGGLGIAIATNTALWTVALGAPDGLVQGGGTALIGGFAMSIVFAVVAAFGLVGMGDVKLTAAAGAFVRWPLALWALVYVLLAGGVPVGHHCRQARPTDSRAPQRRKTQVGGMGVEHVEPRSLRHRDLRGSRLGDRRPLRRRAPFDGLIGHRERVQSRGDRSRHGVPKPTREA